MVREELPLVVVIDDQDDFREVLVEILEQGGMRVAAYHSGTEGVAAARTLGARLVITDLIMPKPDGIEVARLLTPPSGPRPIPVVLVSARSHSLREPVLQELFDAVLPKPLDPAALVEVVHRLIGSGETTDLE